MGCSLHSFFVGCLWLQLMFPNKAYITLIICSQTSSRTYKSEVFHPTSLSRKLDDTRLSESQHWSRSPRAPAAPSLSCELEEINPATWAARFLDLQSRWAHQEPEQAQKSQDHFWHTLVKKRMSLCWFLPDHSLKNCAVHLQHRAVCTS